MKSYKIEVYKKYHKDERVVKRFLAEDERDLKTSFPLLFPKLKLLRIINK